MCVVVWLSVGVFNFFVDGVVVEVGVCVGVNDCECVWMCVVLVMVLVLVSGMVSVIVCAATLTSSARGAFRLMSEVVVLVNEMFLWVLGVMLFVMVFESVMGMVCGIGRVEMVMWWLAGKAAADAAATFAALGLGRGDVVKMWWIGVGMFVVSVV